MNDRELIKYPVKYEPHGQTIFDAENDMVCNIRGWGVIKYMKDSEEVQDSMGEFIASAINEKLKKK